VGDGAHPAALLRQVTDGAPPSGDAVRTAAKRVVGGWARRYRGVAAGVLVFMAIVAALPSTSPNAEAPATFASGGGRVPTAAGGSVQGLQQAAPPDTAPAPAFDVAPVASPPADSLTPSPEEPAPVSPAPPGSPGPQPIPGAPACPVPLPPAEAPPSGAPQLFGLFPLAGPFGPEALAFLPVLGHFFVLITPLLPVLQPGLDAAQPTMNQLVPLITQLEAIVLGPATPYIEQQTPQYLDYERQLVQVLEPLATIATDNPAVACVAQLEVLAAAQLAPK